jgi:ferric-dicitrate binding protein FerR (iron transport regulator)
MTNDIPWILIEKVFSEKASSSEQYDFKLWMNNAPENELIASQLRNYYEENGCLPTHFNPNIIEAYSKVNRALYKNNSRQIRFNLPLVFKIAATIALFVIAWWFISRSKPEKSNDLLVTISDTAINDIILADGTHVWLNSGAELSYPQNIKTNREVQLKGEAYFEVAHDSLHPFVVNTGNARIKVLGTKFNIHSSNLDSVDNVVVSEGKVSYGTQKGSVVLFFGDKGVFNKNTGEVIKFTNTDPNYLSWKTKVFVFNDIPLNKVLNDLANVYSLKYEFENPQVSERKLTARFTKLSVNQIMEVIATASGSSIVFRNNKYIIQ